MPFQWKAFLRALASWESRFPSLRKVALFSVFCSPYIYPATLLQLALTSARPHITSAAQPSSSLANSLPTPLKALRVLTFKRSIHTSTHISRQPSYKQTLLKAPLRKHFRSFVTTPRMSFSIRSSSIVQYGSPRSIYIARNARSFSAVASSRFPLDLEVETSRASPTAAGSAVIPSQLDADQPFGISHATEARRARRAGRRYLKNHRRTRKFRASIRRWPGEEGRWRSILEVLLQNTVQIPRTHMAVDIHGSPASLEWLKSEASHHRIHTNHPVSIGAQSLVRVYGSAEHVAAFAKQLPLLEDVRVLDSRTVATLHDTVAADRVKKGGLERVRPLTRIPTDDVKTTPLTRAQIHFINRLSATINRQKVTTSGIAAAFGHPKVKSYRIDETFEAASNKVLSTEAFNLALRYLVRHDALPVSRYLLRRMKDDGFKRTAETYNFLLKSCARNGHVSAFHHYLLQMISDGLRPDAQTWVHLLRLSPSRESTKRLLAAMDAYGHLKYTNAIHEAASTVIVRDIVEQKAAGVSIDEIYDRLNGMYGPMWLSQGCIATLINTLSRTSSIDDALTIVNHAKQDYDFVPNEWVIRSVLSHFRHTNSLTRAIDFVATTDSTSQMTWSKKPLDLVFRTAWQSQAWNVTRAVFEYAARKQLLTQHMIRCLTSSVALSFDAKQPGTNLQRFRWTIGRIIIKHPVEGTQQPSLKWLAMDDVIANLRGGERAVAVQTLTQKVMEYHTRSMALRNARALGMGLKKALELDKQWWTAMRDDRGDDIGRAWMIDHAIDVPSSPRNELRRRALVRKAVDAAGKGVEVNAVLKSGYARYESRYGTLSSMVRGAETEHTKHIQALRKKRSVPHRQVQMTHGKWQGVRPRQGGPRKGEEKNSP